MISAKLRYSLANDALLHFFHNEYWSDEEIDFLNNFCFYNNSDRAWKLKMRLLYEENNDMIVAAVLADASIEERMFLYDRFAKNLSFVKIGFQLNLHPNALQRWRDKFFNEIASLMNYDLPGGDIFSCNKVEALNYVLERSIGFFEEYGNTDKKILDSLKFKLEVYQNLLFAIRYFLNSESSDVGCKIIQAKISFPSLSAEELEQLVGFSHTTVSKYSLAFHRQFCPQIH
ncbi:MAG: hypothetical protein IK062_07185 [Selenomonadaceae bacterium]|nr:hypothetical protein [Selenomonadaceae bacterium]